MRENDPRKVPRERLLEIWKRLDQAGHAQAAKELSGHIAYMDDELTMTQQYYEEFLVPGMEGHAVGAWSDRVVVPGRDGKGFIRQKSGKTVDLV